MSPAVVARRPYRGSIPERVSASPTVVLPHVDAARTAQAVQTWRAYARGEDAPYRVVSIPPVVTAETVAALRAEEPVVLSAAGDVVLQGPLRLPLFAAVVSPGSIRVEGNVVLDNTLFVARDSISIGAAPPYGNLSPSLVGEQMAPHGSAQLVATGRVTLGSGTHLSYPSLVTVVGRADASRVVVADSAQVDGFVFGGSTAEVVLRPRSRLRGAVLALGSAEVRGSVEGSVLTAALTAHFEETYYVGWLIGGSIRAPRRPVPFVLPLGFGEKTHPVLLDQHTLARPRILPGPFP